MTKGMTVLKNAWKERKGPAVFTTVGANNIPNSIYVGEVRLMPEAGFVIADNYFSKTRKNIKDGSTGALLFLTAAGKAYQVKGKITYHTDGSIFDQMKSWNNPKHPGVAAVLLKVEELYSGAEQII